MSTKINDSKFQVTVGLGWGVHSTKDLPRDFKFMLYITRFRHIFTPPQ